MEPEAELVVASGRMDIKLSALLEYDTSAMVESDLHTHGCGAPNESSDEAVENRRSS
jgi:hypothetical protein